VFYIIGQISGQWSGRDLSLAKHLAGLDSNPGLTQFLTDWFLCCKERIPVRTHAHFIPRKSGLTGCPYPLFRSRWVCVYYVL